MSFIRCKMQSPCLLSQIFITFSCMYVCDVIQEAWPSNLKEYVQRSVSLSLCRSLPLSVASQAFRVRPHLARGMSQKKLHEVRELA